MRAVLDNRIKKISEQLLVAVAHALADIIPEQELGPFHIIPDVTDRRIQPAVNKAVKGIS
jgi:malate dehydrogenase (oxaloacetate-decarboxylating)